MISSVKDIHLDSTVFSCFTCNKTDWLSSMKIVFIITCFWPHFCPVALVGLDYVETNVISLLLWLKQYRQMKWLCYIHHHHHYHMYEELLSRKEHKWQKSGGVCVYTHTHTHIVVVKLLSCVWLFVTPQTAACQASLSFTISWSLLRFMIFKFSLILYIYIYMYFYIFTLNI